MVSTEMKVSVGVLLHQYSPRGSERGISHDEEGFGSVWDFYYWGRQEYFFEFDEHIVLFPSPLEDHPFFCQVVKWSSKCREVRDELSVEVAESDERSDCLDRLRWFPLLDSLEFGRIHEYFSILDYQS